MKHRDGKSLLVTGGTETASTRSFIAPTFPNEFADTSDTSPDCWSPHPVVQRKCHLAP